MSTKESTIQFIVEQLSSLRGVMTRKMFGEYCLYCQDKVVGLICDDMVYIKPTVQGTPLIEGRYELAPPYTGAKPAMLLNEDVLEDRELFSRLIATTANALPLPKPKSKK